MKKKKSLVVISTIGSALMLCTILLSNSANMLTDTYGGIQTYGVSFNSSKNKFHSYTGNTGYNGETIIKTDLGNNVNFTYHDIKGINTTWHVLGSEGYFYNTDPIHGMDRITLSFKTNNSNYEIFYSYDDSFDYSQAFISSTNERTTFDFSGYQPNYFKVVNNSGSNFNISSVDISLSCINNHPTATLHSENTTMGSVSGGGVKTSGEQVTINATPNQGYRFVGWYDGEALVSTQPSYSFTIGNEDISYVARFTYETYNFVVESESLVKGLVSNSSGQYDYLSDVTIEATPNTGYSFRGWYEGNDLVSTDNPYTFAMPYANKTYTAKFTANPYDLTLVNANEELGSVTGEGTYLYGSSVTIVATPNTGVSFLGWYNNEDQEVCSTESYTFDMPHEDIEYTAKFAWTPYSVTVNINDDEMGSVTGAGSYTYGQQVNLVATPEEHHSFFGWYINDELYSRETWLTFNMPSDNLVYEARFVKNYNLNVYSDDESMGTVSAPTEWGAGLEVTVTANANIGYAIDYWYDYDLNEVSYDSSYTFIMPENDVDLYAAFAKGYTLTVLSSDESKGTVSGSGQYKAGRNVTVRMTYISGTFKGWLDSNENLVSNDNPYSFLMVSGNYTLIAYFMTEEDEAKQLGIIPEISNDGKTLTYGLYPQTNINDSALIASLNALTPESNGWYLYDGEYYAKASATPESNGYTPRFKNGLKIVSGTTYWFKCELITWNILSDNNGEYYILSSVLLDVQKYYRSGYSRTINGETIYANNYEYSDIRAWLNDDFYNSAFALGDNYIQTTDIDNSTSTTESSSNPYACNNTQDKVFLPSYQDYSNSSYGFSISTRVCKTTDFAVATGIAWNFNGTYDYPGPYWTRSPSNMSQYYSFYVNFDGNFNHNIVNTQNHGVRPSITLVIV